MKMAGSERRTRQEGHKTQQSSFTNAEFKKIILLCHFKVKRTKIFAKESLSQSVYCVIQSQERAPHLTTPSLKLTLQLVVQGLLNISERGDSGKPKIKTAFTLI